MRKTTLILAMIAISGLVACKHETTTEAQPAAAAQVAPAPAAQAAPDAAAAQAAPATPTKMNLRAEPGRTMVITDLQVQGARAVPTGNLRFHNPQMNGNFRPGTNVGLRRAPAQGTQPANGAAPTQPGSNQ